MAGAASALRAVHGHVVVTAQHVTWAEMAQDWRAPLWSASVSSMTMLGGVHHAVDITGAGRGPPRGWI